MPPDFELFDVESGELFIVVGGVEYSLAEFAPELAQQVEAAGGIDALTASLWQNILEQGDWRPRLFEIASQRSVGTEAVGAGAPAAQGEPGAPVWWTPQVAQVLGATSWEAYLQDASRELPVAVGGLNQGTQAERVAKAIKAARDVASNLGVALEEQRTDGTFDTRAEAQQDAQAQGESNALITRNPTTGRWQWEAPKEERPDGTFATGIEAKEAAAAEGVVDALVLRDPVTGRWTWDFPEMDPIARQVFTSEQAAFDAAPPGFRPKPIQGEKGVIWGFERIPEAGAAPQRSLQQIIDDNIIAGNFARAMELHGLRRMLEDEPEALGLEAVTQIATEFSTNAEEFRELFQLLTREQRTAAAVAPLNLGQFEGRLGQVVAARAGLLGVPGQQQPQDLFEGIFPEQPGVAGALREQRAGPNAVELARLRIGDLLPGQDEATIQALAEGRAGSNALALAREALAGISTAGLAGLSAQAIANLSTRAASGATGSAVFIEDILGVDAIRPEQVEGLTLAQLGSIAGIDPTSSSTGVILSQLRRGAGLSGPAPTEADLASLLGQRREAAATREREETAATAAATETERLSRVEAGKRRTGRRIFI